MYEQSTHHVIDLLLRIGHDRRHSRRIGNGLNRIVANEFSSIWISGSRRSKRSCECQLLLLLNGKLGAEESRCTCIRVASDVQSCLLRLLAGGRRIVGDLPSWGK
jgi:hypothetical protein